MNDDQNLEISKIKREMRKEIVGSPKPVAKVQKIESEPTEQELEEYF